MSRLKELIDKILTEKESRVKELIAIIDSMDDIRSITILMFFLVDNFKDEKIFPKLIELIKNEKYKTRNGSLVYLCGEYSLYECSQKVDFFLELLCEHDGEVGMTASSILFDASSLIEFNSDNTTRWLEYLTNANKKRPHNVYIHQAIKLLIPDSQIPPTNTPKIK